MDLWSLFVYLFCMADYYFSIPYEHYPLQAAFSNLGARILIHGFVHLEGWRFSNSGDPFWRLYWNRQPGAQVEQDGEEIRIDPDSIMLIPPDRSFSADLRNPVDHFYIHFVLDPPYLTTAPRIVRFPLDENRRSLLFRIIECAKQKGLSGPKGSVAVFELVLNALADLSSETWGGQYTDPRIRKVLEMMHRQDAVYLDNSILANAVNMSCAAFVRLFSTRMGIPPMQYAMQCRLSRAAILLVHTERGIDDIAVECGFCERGHLSRFFKRKYGVGPAQYRKAGRLRRGADLCGWGRAVGVGPSEMANALLKRQFKRLFEVSSGLRTRYGGG